MIQSGAASQPVIKFRVAQAEAGRLTSTPRGSTIRREDKLDEDELSCCSVLQRVCVGGVGYVELARRFYIPWMY